MELYTYPVALYGELVRMLTHAVKSTGSGTVGISLLSVVGRSSLSQEFCFKITHINTVNLTNYEPEAY